MRSPVEGVPTSVFFPLPRPRSAVMPGLTWLQQFAARLCRRALRRPTDQSPRPRLERLEDRTTPSVLAYGTPFNSGFNTVVLQINGNNFEVLDNGSIAASQAVSATTAITLTGGVNTVNSFFI